MKSKLILWMALFACSAFGQIVTQPQLTRAQVTNIVSGMLSVASPTNAILRDSGFGTNATLIKRTKFKGSGNSFTSTNIHAESSTGKRLLLLTDSGEISIPRATITGITNLWITGDSLSVFNSDLSTGEAYRWGMVLSNYLQIPNLTNAAVGSRRFSHMFPDLYIQQPSTNSAYAGLFGVNDMRSTPTAAAATGYGEMLKFSAAWLAIPHSQKIIMTSSVPVLTGSWTTESIYGRGKYSSTLGNTIAFTNSGTSVFIGYQKWTNATGGSFSVTVDGVNYGTNNCFAGNNNGTTNVFQPALFQISGLTNGAHSIVISVTSSTDAAKPVYIDWSAGNGGNDYRSGPFVWFGNCVRTTPAGYGIWSGSDASVYLINRELSKSITDLAMAGLNTVLVDVSSHYKPEIHTDTDGLHPTIAGDRVIAEVFIKSLNQLAYPNERQVVRGLTDGSLRSLYMDGGLIRGSNGVIYIPSLGGTEAFVTQTQLDTNLALKANLTDPIFDDQIRMTNSAGTVTFTVDGPTGDVSFSGLLSGTNLTSRLAEKASRTNSLMNGAITMSPATAGGSVSLALAASGGTGQIPVDFKGYGISATIGGNNNAGAIIDLRELSGQPHFYNQLRGSTSNGFPVASTYFIVTDHANNIGRIAWATRDSGGTLTEKMGLRDGGLSIGMTNFLARLGIQGAGTSSGYEILSRNSASTVWLSLQDDGTMTNNAAVVNRGVNTFSSTISAPTNTANFSITTTDFVINTYYTNSNQRASASASISLTNILSSDFAKVALYVDQGADGTFEQTGIRVALGGVALVADEQQLWARLQPGARFMFTNLSAGTASAGIISGSCQFVKE